MYMLSVVHCLLKPRHPLGQQQPWVEAAGRDLLGLGAQHPVGSEDYLPVDSRADVPLGPSHGWRLGSSLFSASRCSGQPRHRPAQSWGCPLLGGRVWLSR